MTNHDSGSPDGMANESDSLTQPYDVAAFREQAHAVVDLLAEYLSSAESGEIPVVPIPEPEVLMAEWPNMLESRRPLLDLMTEVLAKSSHQHHPGYLGQQVTAPLPLTALTGMCAALLNNSSAIYEGAPVTTVMERRVIRWMADEIGYGPEADGVLTSGGALGNLTALLAARQARAPWDVWSEGLQHGSPLAVLVSEESHYTAQRGAVIMGLGEQSVLKVPVNESYQMSRSSLQATYERAQSDGLHVIATVANACSTSTGTFDDLEMIADFCAERGVWFHVDAAHGAPALLSARYANLLRGIERADSVIWDAHKMMLIPSGCTGVIFQRGEDSAGTFRQRAEYLVGTSNWAEFSLAQRTLECTKNMMALHPYVALAVLGRDYFGRYVEQTFDLASWFADQLECRPSVQLAITPQSNIVCFRYGVGDERYLDAFQETLRDRIIEDGEFFITRTVLDGAVYLRLVIINPLTTHKELLALIEKMERLGRTGATVRSKHGSITS